MLNTGSSKKLTSLNAWRAKWQLAHHRSGDVLVLIALLHLVPVEHDVADGRADEPVVAVDELNHPVHLVNQKHANL